MIQIPAFIWSIAKLLLIVIIASAVSVIYVPYNTDLTGEWLYGDDKHRMWLSRTCCGSYGIYDIDGGMNQIGSLTVDRMLNLNKYDIVNPTGYLEDIVTKRISLNKKNSKMTLRGDDIEFAKK